MSRNWSAKEKARLSSDKNSHSILQFFTPSSSSRDDSQPVILDLSDELISSDSDSDTESGDVPRSAEEESTAEVAQPLIIDNEAVHLEPYQPRQKKFAAIRFGKQLRSCLV